MVQTFVNFLKEAKMVRVVIMGGPGSGKSTYSEYIIRHFGIKHIYPGGLLRKEIDKGGPDGQKIKNLLDQGKFAPNDIVLKLIRSVKILTEFLNKRSELFSVLIFSFHYILNI